MYTMESETKDDGIYIVEDSEIDLGLTASVERNLERYLQIITEVLTWHELKMKEKPAKEEPDEEFKPNFRRSRRNLRTRRRKGSSPACGRR